MIPGSVGGWLMVLAMLTSGCGMMVKFKAEEIQLLTPEVSGANCEITDKRGRKWQVESTPAAVTVSAGASPLSVICQRRGYKPTVVLVESMNFWRRNDQLPLSGATFGEAAGQGRYYPQVIEVWMEHSVWKEEDEKKAWLIRRARSHLSDVEVLVNPKFSEDNPQPPTLKGDSLWQAEEQWIEWVKSL
ncbi:MAG: hypothetical protein G8345_20265 [Magnetococcales bacterium]|nr:hypothetical protein [Magnetococcales bacterium]